MKQTSHEATVKPENGKIENEQLKINNERKWLPLGLITDYNWKYDAANCTAKCIAKCTAKCIDYTGEIKYYKNVKLMWVLT